MKTIRLIDESVGQDGSRILPSLGITVKLGQTAEVPDDVADNLLEQSDVWTEGE